MSPHSTSDNESQYGYIPHEYVAVIFLVLFGIILHISQAIYYRMWWILPTACLCGIGELVGWSGRLWSSFSPSLKTPFLMQLVLTVLAPTPLIAVNFVLLFWLVARLGLCYAHLTPNRYTALFLSCDIMALAVQGVGGGLASSASDQAGVKQGVNIILAGIVFQFGSIITYCCLACDFLVRYLMDRPLRIESGTRCVLEGRIKTMIYALAFSTLLLFIRSVYRIVELADGWTGCIMHTEAFASVTTVPDFSPPTTSPFMTSDGVYIRQYRPADFPQVRALLFEGFVTSKGSVAVVAKWNFLLKAPSLIAYFLAGCGGVVLYSLPHWDNVAACMGALLLAMGIAIFVAIRRSITNAMKGFCEKALQADMLDIEKHYAPPAAFFVVARPVESDKKSDDGEKTEKVLGYVGLEYFPEKKTHTAEVRRMIVSKKHHRQGLATRLMEAVIAHAETIRGLDAIELGTSEFQYGARALYEKLGWEFQGSNIESAGILTASIHRFRRPVEKKRR
ncbi:RTA1 like protein-domain-containing protein [Mycena capillaripes]|nr:RTA1 like protein-domain-containing protein [Mycena capillaripes]